LIVKIFVIKNSRVVRSNPSPSEKSSSNSSGERTPPEILCKSDDTSRSFNARNRCAFNQYKKVGWDARWLSSRRKFGAVPASGRRATWVHTRWQWHLHLTHSRQGEPARPAWGVVLFVQCQGAARETILRLKSRITGGYPVVMPVNPSKIDFFPLCQTYAKTYIISRYTKYL